MREARATQLSEQKWQRLRVLLFVPNLVDYGRLLLLLLFLCTYSSRPLQAAILYVLSVSLDAIDGALARRYQQSSTFGALLDVLVDNLGRSILWALAIPSPYGTLVPVLEWYATRYLQITSQHFRTRTLLCNQA